ncbi:MAG: tRNA lysidine(34) synthetase TilS [Erysipelotrichaceae bacterium]|nr:tRNA lysidine(34) synthetase TilS [Erysipelotrichaceae bacterium]
MALLDMARREGFYIETAHVNYHRRKTADRDEELVRYYCEKCNIPFHLLDSDPDLYKGNFQACAREERYRFFADLCRDNQLDAVLIAHQRDDLIETYLMQKERNLGVSHYGLAESNQICGVMVIRPLLDWDRKDILTYCKENGVPYGIDESNLSDVYTRNRIRHESVEKMSDTEKEEILAEIRRKNEEKAMEDEAVSVFLEKDGYPADVFLSYPYVKTAVRKIFPGKSDMFIEDTLRQIRESDRCQIKEKEMIMVKEYGMVSFFKAPEPYSYTFASMEELNETDYPYFKIQYNGNTKQAVTLQEDDFPVTIRSFQQGDSIQMRYGTKKIRRFFIDNKIPLRKRMIWPVVLNRKGDIVLVPEIGCDLNHYSEKPNLFVIEY